MWLNVPAHLGRSFAVILKAKGDIWALAFDTRVYMYTVGEFANGSGRAYVTVFKP